MTNRTSIFRKIALGVSLSFILVHIAVALGGVNSLQGTVVAAQALATDTPVPSGTPSPVPTLPPSATPSPTITLAPSGTPSPTSSRTPTSPPSATPTRTPTLPPSATPSATFTRLPTGTPSPTPTLLPSATPTSTMRSLTRTPDNPPLIFLSDQCVPSLGLIYFYITNGGGAMTSPGTWTMTQNGHYSGQFTLSAGQKLTLAHGQGTITLTVTDVPHAPLSETITCSKT